MLVHKLAAYTPKSSVAQSYKVERRQLNTFTGRWGVPAAHGRRRCLGRLPSAGSESSSQPQQPQQPQPQSQAQRQQHPNEADVSDSVEAAWSFLKEFTQQEFRGRARVLLAGNAARDRLRSALSRVYTTPCPAEGWNPGDVAPEVLLGVTASDARLAVRALRDWCSALALPYTPPTCKVPGVAGIGAVQGAVYIKFNSRSQVCYLTRYQGADRGVLVQLGGGQLLGHFPPGLWDESMTAPPPSLHEEQGRPSTSSASGDEGCSSQGGGGASGGDEGGAPAPLLRRQLLLLAAGGPLLVAADASLASGDGDPADAAVTAAAAPDANASAQQTMGQAADGVGHSPTSRRQAAKKQQRKKPTAQPPAKPAAIPRVRLGGGLEISAVIRGCWQLDGQHRGDTLSDRTSGAAAIEDLEAYRRAGMWTLDTADNYGPSEATIGQHLRLNPGAQGVTRVFTKLSFMTPPPAADLRRDAIEYRVRASLARMGLAVGDVVQLHWEPPAAADALPRRGKASNGEPGYVSAAHVLQQLQQVGLIRAWGVSNFDTHMLTALLDAGLVPASNQVAYSVLDRRPALFTARLCEARGVPLLAYGTLAGGLLADRYLGVPADKVRIDTLSKARYGMLVRQLGGWAWLQDMLAVLHDVGSRHGVSASCVASRWALQQPGVAAIVLGARNATHIRDAQRLFAFELNDVDMFDIDAAYEGAHAPASDVYAWERGGDW